MKKILSLTLVLAMVMSMGVTTAFAAGNWEGGTQVTYTATGAEEWTVTVPATLTPGNAGDVTAAGTWGSNRKLVVTADDSVKLTNSINSADYKDLAVTFADINLVGNNTQSVSETKQVSVAAMPADALFGTWSGTFYYDVEMVDVITLQPAEGQFVFTINGTPYLAEDGMFWGAWANSEFNTSSDVVIDHHDNMAIGTKALIKENAPSNYVESTNSEIIPGVNYVASTQDAYFGQ